MKQVMQELPQNLLQGTKNNLRVQNNENYKNNAPQPQNKAKNANSIDGNNLNLKITMADYDLPYTEDRLSKVIDTVEDFLLDHRGIKVEPTLIDNIKMFLFNAKYTPTQFSLAKLWIERGAWPQSKKSLEVSDFYPKTSQLEFAHSQLLTHEFAYKKLNALKTEYELTFKKRLIEWEQNSMDAETFDLQQENLRLMQDLIREKMKLNIEIDKLQREIQRQNKEISRLNNIILRRNEIE